MFTCWVRRDYKWKWNIRNWFFMKLFAYYDNPIMTKRMFGSLFGSSSSLLSTVMSKESPFLAICVKTWLLRVRVCKWADFYPVFLGFNGINQIDKHTVNITPLRILSKMLKGYMGIQQIALRLIGCFNRLFIEMHYMLDTFICQVHLFCL